MKNTLPTVAAFLVLISLSPLGLATKSEACSLGFDPSAVQYTSKVIPSIGASNVPTNTWIFVGGTHVFIDEIPSRENGGLIGGSEVPTDEMLKDVTLIDASGDAVPVQKTWLLGSALGDTDEQENYMILIPRGGLEANAGYSVQAGSSAISTFITGAAADTAAPAAPTLALEETQTLLPDCNGFSCTSPAVFSTQATFDDGLLLIVEDTHGGAENILANLFFDSEEPEDVTFVLGAYAQDSFQLSSFTYNNNSGVSTPVVSYAAVVLDSAGNFSEVTRTEIDTNPDVCIGPISTGGCSALHDSRTSAAYPGAAFALLAVPFCFLRRRRR